MNWKEEDLSTASVKPFEVGPTIDDATKSQGISVTSDGIDDVKSAKTQLT